jgi:hypothetical protein
VRGCIPSKALIQAARQFEPMTREVLRQPFGDKPVGAPPSLDFGETIRWKDGIVTRLSNGVGILLKRAKVNVVNGWATFSDAETCEVATAEGLVAITAGHIILANGSEPVELPFFRFGRPVISSTEALSLTAAPKRLVGQRWESVGALSFEIGKLTFTSSTDIFIESYGLGVMERLGVGPLLYVEKSHLIWPLAQAADHDINYIAITGALHAIGSAGRPPIPPLNYIGDYGRDAMLLLRCVDEFDQA